MTYLQNQHASFMAETASAASRMPTQKRGVSPPPSRPSPAPSSVHRQPPSAPPPQPPRDHSTTNIMSQVTQVVTWLRDTKDGRFVPFHSIASYLSIWGEDQTQHRLTIEHILKSHSKVEYSPPPTDQPEGSGKYRFRPLHNVRSAEDLLAVLQARSTAEGIPVKELKEGWPPALEVINDLDAQGLVLTTRNKKDNTAKRVWANDPSLLHPVDAEFKILWAGLKPPGSKGDLRLQLLEYGLNPTSVVKGIKAVVKEGGKKKRTRRGGKVTNTHMSSVLRNFDHLKK